MRRPFAIVLFSLALILNPAARPAQAATGTARPLVVLAEFGGPDTLTCGGSSGQFTGPRHNALPRPLSAADVSGNTIWTEDFSADWYTALLWGAGVQFDYARADGSHVQADFTGLSLADYYADVSADAYTLAGDVVGWVQLPHSLAYYSGQCGQRDTTHLVYDALAAVDALSPTLPDFDWRHYDANGDGVIDELWLIHAGYGAEADAALRERTDYAAFAPRSGAAKLEPGYEIGGIIANRYVLAPENVGITLLAREHARRLGGLELTPATEGVASSGYWSLLGDTEIGSPVSFLPPALDPWHLDRWGWLDPLVISDPAQVYSVTLGQASDFPGDTGLERGVRIALPDGRAALPVPVWQGDEYWWAGRENTANGQMTLAAALTIPAGGAQLAFDVTHELEDGRDFLWVEVGTENGADPAASRAHPERVNDTTRWTADSQSKDDTWMWRTLTNAATRCDHAADWIGGEYGFPDDLCAAGMGGLTGFNASWPAADRLVFDLTPYAGQAIRLRFWAMTDAHLVLRGAFVDDVKVTAGEDVLLADDAEADTGLWTYQAPWRRADGSVTFHHSYYLQYRNVSESGGYDRTLGASGWADGPANSGLLIWYANDFYGDNEIDQYIQDAPGFGPKGRLLLVDAHPLPFRDPDVLALGYHNEAANIHHRGLLRDAAFSLTPTAAFTYPSMVPGSTAVNTYPARAGVSGFHDALGYYGGAERVQRGTAYPANDRKWITRQWDASVVVPARAFYGISAPGYEVSESFRYQCQPIWSGAPGRITCRVIGAGSSDPENAGLGYPGGSGNPGDLFAQYGWHVQLTAQTATAATVRIWNALTDLEGAVTQTPITEPVRRGSTIRVGVNARNIGSPIDGYFFVPLSPLVSYVPGSVQGGAYPVTAGLAAQRGWQATGGAAADDIVGVAFDSGKLAAGASVAFNFIVRVTANAGQIEHGVAAFDGSRFVQGLGGAALPITPTEPQRTRLPLVLHE